MADDWKKYRNQLTRARDDELARKDRKRRNNPALTSRKPPGALDLDQVEPGTGKVQSKQMSLAEVNALILAFRDGDKKAETKLYFRYIRRIKMLMKKSPWYGDLKDPESLAIDIWMKLCEWFQEHTIEKGEGAVLSNRVRGMCRDQAVKDQRETASGDASNPTEENEGEESGGKFGDIVNLYKLLVERDEFTGETPKKIDEAYLNMRMSFRKLIARCLKNLTDRQREVLDHMFFLGRSKHVPGEVEKTKREVNLNHREVAERLNITTSAAYQHKQGGLKRLLDCLGNHGVLCLGDIL